MAFIREKLSGNISSGTNNTTPSLFLYDAGADNRAAVNASGYFNAAAQILPVAAMIIVKGSDGNQVSAVATVSAAGVVTTTAHYVEA